MLPIVQPRIPQRFGFPLPAECKCRCSGTIRCASYLVSPVTAIDARLRLMISDSQLQLIMVWNGLDHPEDYGEETDINTQGRLPSARLIFSTVSRSTHTPLCGSFKAKRTSRVLGLELLSYTAVHPIVIRSVRGNIPPRALLWQAVHTATTQP